MLKDDWPIIVTLLVVLAVLVYNVYLMSTGFDKEFVEGFYSHESVDGDGFFCVYTKGRPSFVVADTFEHEACHSQIHKKPEHFCGDYK